MAMAKRVGCDAVKFQKRNLDICVPEAEKNKLRFTPSGEMTYLEYRHRVEFNFADYQEINQYAKELKIEWSASAWDTQSQKFLRQFRLPFNKVASAMLTHLKFLEEVASEQRLTYVSTGMSELKDIDAAVNIFRSADCPLVLMHTTSTYPALDSELNLALIPFLSHRYQLPVGYSGHETSVSPSVVAAALGACAIERHITLDRSMYGSDQAASLEERGLHDLVAMVRKITVVYGEADKRVLESEKPIARKLRNW
jgi:N-acetylneuraminate synthase